jgi:hypothetical protein
VRTVMCVDVNDIDTSPASPQCVRACVCVCVCVCVCAVISEVI